MITFLDIQSQGLGLEGSRIQAFLLGGVCQEDQECVGHVRRTTILKTCFVEAIVQGFEGFREISKKVPAPILASSHRVLKWVRVFASSLV